MPPGSGLHAPGADLLDPAPEFIAHGRVIAPGRRDEYLVGVAAVAHRPAVVPTVGEDASETLSRQIEDMRHLGGPNVDVFSGGTEPATSLNEAAIAAMAEKGTDISRELPQP